MVISEVLFVVLEMPVRQSLVLEISFVLDSLVAVQLVEGILVIDDVADVSSGTFE